MLAELVEQGRDLCVILNVERSLMIARPLLEIELEDELMTAPVFRP